LITLNDLVGFTELTDADVCAIVRHEHVTVLEAIRTGCRMMISEIEASLARLARLNVDVDVLRRKLPQKSSASAGRG